MSFIPSQYQYQSITVKNECFPKVLNVYINGLTELHKLYTEHSFFIDNRNGFGNMKSKSFSELNCKE